jgi:hypothetical protein
VPQQLVHKPLFRPKPGQEREVYVPRESRIPPALDGNTPNEAEAPASFQEQRLDAHRRKEQLLNPYGHFLLR